MKNQTGVTGHIIDAPQRKSVNARQGHRLGFSGLRPHERGWMSEMIDIDCSKSRAFYRPILVRCKPLGRKYIGSKLATANYYKYLPEPHYSFFDSRIVGLLVSINTSNSSRSFRLAGINIHLPFFLHMSDIYIRIVNALMVTTPALVGKCCSIEYESAVMKIELAT
jgi:hypothetical protein